MPLFVLVAFFFASGYLVPDDTRIATRHDVADSLYIQLGSEFPSTVTVGERGGDGTLVASDWVVTAAHVAAGVVRRYGDELKIFPDASSQGIRVAQVIIHPDFKPMGDFDIALIRLAEPVEDIEPARLYSDSDEKARQIFIVGHGDTKTGTGGEWIVDGLRRGATNIIDEVTDRHIIFDFDDPRAPSGTITSLEGTAGRGDSGGPAYIGSDSITYLAGVSSRGRGGATGPGTYGAEEHYVRLSSHTEWLRQQMENPPDAKRVNMPDQGDRRAVRQGPGKPGPDGSALPPWPELLESIGLIVAGRDGVPRMIGRIDQTFPQSLLDVGIRPPARINAINGQRVESVAEVRASFDTIDPETEFTLTFEHAGTTSTFLLVK